MGSSEEPTFENVIVALDNAGRQLADINLIFGMLSSSDLDEKMQEVQNDFMPRLEQHYNAIMLNDSTIRFLDPPLHEFVPTEEADIKALADSQGKTVEYIKQVIQAELYFVHVTWK